MPNHTELNKHLAEKVMEWHITNDEPYPYDVYYYSNNDDGKMIMVVSNWNPSENIEQAFECAKELAKHSIVKIILNDESTICDIDFEKYYSFVRDDEYPPFESGSSMAISLACAKATKWKEYET